MCVGSQEKAEFIDMVAQAVIDRIEERDRVAMMVEQVVARVMQLQKEEASLNAAATDDDKDEAATNERNNPGGDQPDA